MRLTKPAPGTAQRDRYVKRQARRQVKMRLQAAEQRKARAAEKQRRLQCWLRDKKRCRACGVKVLLETDNPFKLMHAHHFVYRSAGGSDELWNRITLCPACHAAEHEARLVITGDPNGTLRFFTVTRGGPLGQSWESSL